MALKHFEVISDTGSVEVATLIAQYNSLVTVFNDLVALLKTALDVTGVNIAAAAAETSLAENVSLVNPQPTLPVAPSRYKF